jgi:hypothetical protein
LIETIGEQLVLPIFTDATPLATPKLLPWRIMVVAPFVGPFLGTIEVMDGASYPTLNEALWPPTATVSVRLAPDPAAVINPKAVDEK